MKAWALDFLIKHLHLLIILAVSVIFMLPLITGGFFLSHDSVTHVARTASYEVALRDGQLPPRWSAQANYGFGSPFMIFYYPLASYSMVGLRWLGMHFETTYVVFNIFLFILTPLTFYLWARQLFKKEAALAASIFYTALPYHFLLVYVRGAPGEMLAFALLPFLFYCIEKLRKRLSIPVLLLLSLGYAMLMLSHNGMTVIFTPVLAAYALLRLKKASFLALGSMAFGLMLSAFFWIPAILEAKYTNFLFYFGGMYREHFIHPLSAVYSMWGFGPDVNLPGGLSPQVGIPAFLIFLISVWVFLKAKSNQQKTERIFLAFWLLVFLIGIFFSTQFSGSIWQHSDFLKRFQFPWRFMALSALSSAALAGYLFTRIKTERILYVVIIMLVLTALPFVRVKEHIRLGDTYYYAYPGSTYYHNEATTVWSAGDPGKRALQQIEVIEGEGEVKNLVKKSQVHTFTVAAKTDMKIVDHTLLFPGWLVWVDGEQVPIEFQDPRYRGEITFAVPKGEHSVEVRFIETRERKAANLISLLGIGLFLMSLLLLVFLKVKKTRFSTFL